MNVLIVTDTYQPDINGVARTLEALARGLAARESVRGLSWDSIIAQFDCEAFL